MPVGTRAPRASVRGTTTSRVAASTGSLRHQFRANRINATNSPPTLKFVDVVVSLTDGTRNKCHNLAAGTAILYVKFPLTDELDNRVPARASVLTARVG